MRCQVDRYKLGVQGVICGVDLHLGILSINMTFKTMKMDRVSKESIWRGKEKEALRYQRSDSGGNIQRKSS